MIDRSISVAIKFDPLMRAELIRTYHAAQYDITVNHSCQGVFGSALHTNISHMFGVFIQPRCAQPVRIRSVVYWFIVVVVTTTILLVALYFRGPEKYNSYISIGALSLPTNLGKLSKISVHTFQHLNKYSTAVLPETPRADNPWGIIA